VLHLDTSIQTRGSVSRRLSAAAVGKLKTADSNLEVTYRDLTAPLFTAYHAPGACLAQGTDVSGLSPTQQADAAKSAKMLEEFQAADIIVIGVATYNYSVPARSKPRSTAWCSLADVQFQPLRPRGIGRRQAGDPDPRPWRRLRRWRTERATRTYCNSPALALLVRRHHPFRGEGLVLDAPSPRRCRTRCDGKHRGDVRAGGLVFLSISPDEHFPNVAGQGTTFANPESETWVSGLDLRLSLDLKP